MDSENRFTKSSTNSIVMQSVLSCIPTINSREYPTLVYFYRRHLSLCMHRRRLPTGKGRVCPEPWVCYQRYTTDMKPHVNHFLVVASGKAGNRPLYVWRVFAVQQKTKWPRSWVNRISPSLQNRVGISVQSLWVEVSLPKGEVKLVSPSIGYKKHTRKFPMWVSF